MTRTQAILLCLAVLAAWVLAAVFVMTRGVP